MFSIAAANNRHATQFDVTSAFLNGTIDEDVYIDTPLGVKSKSNKCPKLNKALYDLNQVPRSWYRTLSIELADLDFKQSDTHLCLFIMTNPTVLLYCVDDSLVVGENPSHYNEILEYFKKSFEIRSVDSGIFLNIRFQKHNSAIIIDQQRYTIDILEKYGMASGSSDRCI